jgi:hypothetical protein
MPRVRRFKDKYKPYFTVKDLIQLLQTVDENLPVGKSGHFGEFHPMDIYDFNVTKSRFDPQGENIENYVGWRELVEFHQQPIFEINSPDIGEVPD